MRFLISKLKFGRFGPGLLMALLVLAAALLGLRASAARAETVLPPPHGSSLSPEGPTRVQLVSETVLIDAAPNRVDQIPYARVDATYLLRNQGTEEEQMQLRYPLSMLYAQGENPCQTSPYQPLQAFAAWVNGRMVSYRFEYEKVPNTLAVHETDPAEVYRACWVVFPAAFPPGEDVTIRVRFEQQAGVQGFTGYASYLYEAQRGAGWDGPVGKAEYIFRAPWFLSDETLLYYAPVDGVVEAKGLSGAELIQAGDAAKEIRWQRENFEPAFQDDIQVQILNPPVYQEINKRRLMYPGSRRGEAWGSYGLAAKRAIQGFEGFREGTWAERLYHESYDAYARAVELLPWNANWHAGFAELLCTNAAYPSFDLEWSDEERWNACAVQIQAALQANPRQELALQLIERYGDERYLYLENGTPVFPILSQAIPPRRTLTPIPSATALPTNTPEATDTAIPPTVTATPEVRGTSTPAQIASPISTAEATALLPTIVKGNAQTTAAPGSSRGALCGAALLPLLGLALAGHKTIARIVRPRR